MHILEEQFSWLPICVSLISELKVRQQVPNTMICGLQPTELWVIQPTDRPTDQPPTDQQTNQLEYVELTLSILCWLDTVYCLTNLVNCLFIVRLSLSPPTAVL